MQQWGVTAADQQAKGQGAQEEEVEDGVGDYLRDRSRLEDGEHAGRGRFL